MCNRFELAAGPEALASIAPDVYQGVFDQAETARILGLIFAPLPDLSEAPFSVHTLDSIDAAINASLFSIEEHLQLANTAIGAATALLM